ncbi:MAG: hypothetical protein NTY07_00105 [Bacteroidia bacterium]|nr:hypothetical protein [Bacteroidia bacterium]
MNFVDGITLRFRKQGLSENEIRIKLRRYYFYSKAALAIYLLAFIILVFFERFKTADIFALVLFFLCFAVILMIFLLLRNWTKVNNEF